MQQRKKQERDEAGNRPWMVFDCETDSFDGLPVVPFVWGWKKSTGEEGIVWNTAEFVQVLQEFDGIALAHNGGKFDTVLLAEHFEPGEIKIINGRVAEVKIGRATVRDSFLIIPAPLAASGLKDDFDYEILHRDKKHLRRKHRAEIEKYLAQDCRALYEMVERFYSLYGQKLTQAGAALIQWEKMDGLKRRWGGFHDQHLRQFYYGGRCAAFQKGELGDGWQYYDIKSAYPYAMAHEHPACHFTDYAIENSIRKITPQSFARIQARSRGALPVKGKTSTEYPHHSDVREYHATGWEIIAGLETGTLDIESAIIWTPTALETLKPYVDRFYADKLAAELAGDKVGRTLAKIFLNSLYGKYGSAADEYADYIIVPAGESREGYSLFAEMHDKDILERPSPGQFYDVALAASVTGFARAYLWRHIHMVQSKAGKSKWIKDGKIINRAKFNNYFGVAYCDTDSIICRGENLDFDLGQNLGQWEHVHTLNDFHVAGKKLYAGRDSITGEWVTAHKGFSKLDTDYEDVIKAARGEVVQIARSAPSINSTGMQTFIKRRMRMT